MLRLWHGAQNCVTGSVAENVNGRDAMRVAVHIDFSSGGHAVPDESAWTGGKAPSAPQAPERVVLFRPLPIVGGTRAEWLQEARAPISAADMPVLEHALSSTFASSAALTDTQRSLLWRSRHHLSDRPEALPLVMAAVDWYAPLPNSGLGRSLTAVVKHRGTRRTAAEALRCLKHWKKGSPRDALELLDASSQCGHVRAYAVERLAAVTDAELRDVYLPQLVRGWSRHLSLH